MLRFIFVKLALACCSFLLSGCVTESSYSQVGTDSKGKWVENCSDWDEWDKPGPAFKIYGNTYYVGTCGISAILITSDKGHVLIDGGTESGAVEIARNIESLGYSLQDVKLLLHSHEHFDHVAGLGKIQSMTDAKLLASPEAAPVLSSGILSKLDPQFGLHEPFLSAKVDGVVHEGKVVTLGELSLTPIATPGHSPGALSWQWWACEKEKCLSIVYADSMSPISHNDYRFINHPTYLEEFKKGVKKISELTCDILITPHPSASKMRTRLSSNGLTDEEGCKNYADLIANKLKKRLADESASVTQ